MVVVPLAPLIAAHGQAYMAPAVVLSTVIIGLCAILRLGESRALLTRPLAVQGA